jgi:putrescine transport system ATP-binding protein
VADFVGSLSPFELRVDGVRDGVASMHPTPDERVAVLLSDGGASQGTTLRAAVRPERIRLLAVGAAPTAPDTSLRGVVEAIDYVGTLSHYRVRTAVGTLLSHRLNDDPAGAPPLGAVVTVSWSADAAFVLPD